ncbi:MAG: hypothetical protein J0I84_14130 [Terrimonas sp.]|nr:hypothetical protein [Terrimonas sp.]OJY96924.1 MAG: hypothetical protein BGP13_24910 [Sphingobacteriales bacterium 40-81]
MRNVFYLIFIFIPAVSFSQTPDNDSTEQIIKVVCDDRIFEKCEIPVGFKNGQLAVEDSITNYLKENNTQFQNGKVTFQFVVAKNAKVCDVKKISGNIASEGNIIKALQQIADLWTVGKQNSRFICSYVRLEIEIIDYSVKVNLINLHK